MKKICILNGDTSVTTNTSGISIGTVATAYRPTYNARFNGRTYTGTVYSSNGSIFITAYSAGTILLHAVWAI